jgi:hypothetical protein
VFFHIFPTRFEFIFTSFPLVSSLISPNHGGKVTLGGWGIPNGFLPSRNFENSKTTLETSGEDVKTTLETSEKYVKPHSKRVAKM